MLLNILNQEEPHTRFRDIELILRYLALSEGYKTNLDNYPNNMKSFINNYMTKHRHTQMNKVY